MNAMSYYTADRVSQAVDHPSCLESVSIHRPWHMGIHLRVLGESYSMNTNMTGRIWFSENAVSMTALHESSLNIIICILLITVNTIRIHIEGLMPIEQH